ncbi:MAG TPA: uracil-DNA glycosylase [Pirellulaceae bacterium]|nr:uracil-DNA glycosylase [Pirellulaceae bacterium]
MTKESKLIERDRDMTAVVQQLALWEQAGLDFVSAVFYDDLVASLHTGKTVQPTSGSIGQGANSHQDPAHCETSNLKTGPVSGSEAVHSKQIAKPERDVTMSSDRSSKASAPDNVPSIADMITAGEPYPSRVPADDRPGQLQVIAAEVAECKKCPELVRHRTRTVFGVGNPQPRVCFLGEAPGADEDRQGEPFVGAAGQLLNKIIVASKMTREEVYILNTIKCRPPGNRNPSDLEMSNCWHFARRQLEVLQPEFIVCLGGVAVRGLLGTKLSIARLRGKFHRYSDSRVVVTYHPAFLLRDPRAKHQVWEDMKMLMREMGVELS